MRGEEGLVSGSAIELRGFGKKYASVVAVDDVSLRVRTGEFLTILGPSGSGKTTVLSAIAGFVAPTSGCIFINDEPIDDLPPERRNIGVVFQHYALFPHMTVAENIAFPLEMRATPQRRVAELVRSAARAVRLEEMLDRYPGQLSGGQQQRVAFARAIVFRPVVLLLDEPLSALDKHLRESMQFELKRLHRDTGITTIYVTHDQQEALLLSDRIAVMNRGRVEQVGTPEEIYAHPVNRFVAQFIGESNMLDGTVVARNDATVILETRGGLRCAAHHAATLPGTLQITSFMVRPECIVLGPDAATMPNTYVGRIEERFFMGGVTRLKVALTPSDSLVTNVPSSEAHRDLYLPSHTLAVGWHSEDVAVFSG